MAKQILAEVPGSSSTRIERGDTAKRSRLEQAARAIRALGARPLTQSIAERLAKRLGVHWRTIYRYRDRFAQSGEAAALAGLPRGWKPNVSRLSAKQEQAIEEVIAKLRRSPHAVRMIDLVAQVAERCKPLRVDCPSRPAIERRLKRAVGVRVDRRGDAVMVDADPLQHRTVRPESKSSAVKLRRVSDKAGGAG